MTVLVSFMCGSHPRHLYIANELYKNGLLKSLVVEKREAFIPSPDPKWSQEDKELFIKHFKIRDESENKFFKDIPLEFFKSKVPVLEVSKEELNSEKTLEFLKRDKADVLLTYGVHKISDEIIDNFKDNAFNIHGGLSPEFKGCITMFWPFYLLRPNWAGMTVHRLTKRLDGGDILHQCVPTLEYGDRMHDVANKAIVKLCSDLCLILKSINEGSSLKTEHQSRNGKLWISDDWTVSHLHLIYDYYKDKIVDMYLNGEIYSPEVKLVNFFNCNPKND